MRGSTVWPFVWSTKKESRAVRNLIVWKPCNQRHKGLNGSATRSSPNFCLAYFDLHSGELAPFRLYQIRWQQFLFNRRWTVSKAFSSLYKTGLRHMGTQRTADIMLSSGSVNHTESHQGVSRLHRVPAGIRKHIVSVHVVKMTDELMYHRITVYCPVLRWNCDPSERGFTWTEVTLE